MFFDSDLRECPYPGCDAEFYTVDGSEWSDYAGHLRGHLMDELGYICNCPVCDEPVFESDEGMTKFDPMRPMYLPDDDADACHLGCSDALIEETHAKVPGFSEVASANLDPDGGAPNDGYRTNCDGCGVPLFGTEGHEFGHGSYCDRCAQDYLIDGGAPER